MRKKGQRESTETEHWRACIKEEEKTHLRKDIQTEINKDCDKVGEKKKKRKRSDERESVVSVRALTVETAKVQTEM